MPSAAFADIELHYETAGAGPPLLFISGTGGDLRVRPNVLDGPLTKNFEVLAYDQRGLGRSDKPDRPYSMADYADDAARLMAHVGWERARVVGVSFGGMVAQELVLRHPGRVEALVLACTSPGGDGGASFPFHEIDHLKGEARARHLLPIADTRRDAAWAEANPELHAQFITQTVDPFEGELGRAEGARRQIEARAVHDKWERLGQIACSVMIAAGLYDGIALPEAQRNMAQRIAGAELRFFEGGHMFMLQDRAALPAIVEFLNR